MKAYIILMLALLPFGAATLHAQSAESIHNTEQAIHNKGKYAMLVMKSQHLKVAIKTGIELKDKSGEIDFQIITCGELVKQISQDKELQDLIKYAVNQHGLKILVCGLSVEQLKVDKSLLLAETPLTANGLLYVFGLLEEGYKTITL